MKTRLALRKLSKFRIVNVDNVFYVSSRFSKSKEVKIIDQSGTAIALPLFIEEDGSERVAFHPKTINSLVEFLTIKKGE